MLPQYGEMGTAPVSTRLPGFVQAARAVSAARRAIPSRLARLVRHKHERGKGDFLSMANDEATIAAQPLWLARIQITLKPVVLDPQGDAVLRGLHHLGFAEVTSVRAGKYLGSRACGAQRGSGGASGPPDVREALGKPSN